MLSKTFYWFNSEGAPWPPQMLLYQLRSFTLRHCQSLRTTDKWILHR